MSDFVHHIELSSDDFDTEGLAVRRLRGTEAINTLYSFEVELASGAEELELNHADELLGAAVELTLSSRDRVVLRRVHGLVSWARYQGKGKREHAAIELRVVPRAWRLTLFRTQELFVKRSVVDVIRTKLERVGLDATFHLLSHYPARELVVQYKESDWDFVCRLCEHAGIGFYFQQDESGEHLVFTDHDGGWEATGELLPYGAGGEQVAVTELASEAVGTPAVFAVNDYNYRSPHVDLTGVAQLEGGLPGGVVEYGSHHRTPAEAAAMAQLRMEEAAAHRLLHHGASTLPHLGVGQIVRIDGHEDYDDGKLRLIAVEHEVAFVEGFAEGEQGSYRNRFTASPGELPYRPRRATPRPAMMGLVSAIVQPGPQGEVGGIPRLDDDGRYLVQFHFDGSDYGASPSSQAVRMAQPFVGEGNNGMHFPLQRGTEVLIAFVDGNPDRPIIVGAVPNAANPATIVARQSGINRIQTAQGVTIQFGNRS